MQVLRIKKADSEDSHVLLDLIQDHVLRTPGCFTLHLNVQKLLKKSDFGGENLSIADLLEELIREVQLHSIHRHIVVYISNLDQLFPETAPRQEQSLYLYLQTAIKR